MPHIDEIPDRTAGQKWPWIVVGLLSVHVAGMVTAAMIATHDKSFAVVGNYYERAVHWDQSQALLRASREMGWRIEIRPEDQVDPLGKRSVCFVVTDREGRAIPGAVLGVEYFHDAHASEIQNVTFKAEAGDPRRFGGVLPMRYAGMWEFQMTVSARGKTFFMQKTQTLTNAKRSMVEDAMQ